MITSAQIRAARALLELDQKVIADEANVSVKTVKRAETGEGPPTGSYVTIQSIIEVLIRNGAEFTDENGVRFNTEKGN